MWLAAVLAVLVSGSGFQVDPAAAAVTVGGPVSGLLATAGAAVGAVVGVPAGFVAGSSREVVEERTEFTALFANPDGSKTVRSSSAPLHFSAGDKRDRWERIDTAVVADGAVPGVLRSKANSWTARFRPLPGGVEFDTPEGKLSFSPLGAAAVAPVVTGDGSVVVYPEAWPGVDLRYTVTPTEVKEELVLKRRPGTAMFEFATGGTEFDATPEGGLAPKGRDPKKGRLAPPEVTDTKGTELSAAKPTMRAVKDKGGSRLQLKLDEKFLADTPDSAFPVVFDPTVQLGSGNMQNYKTYPNGAVASCLSACQVRVGNTVEPFNGALTNVYWRSVGYFDYTAALGASVTDVSLDLARNPGDGTAVAHANNVKVFLPSAYSWPGAVGGGALLAQGTVGENTGTQPIRGAGLTNQIAAWARDRVTGGSLGFTGLEQPGLFTYKRFNIFNLNVTYAATPPGTPASLTAAAQRDGSVVLSYPAATPDGGAGGVRYEVKAFTGGNQVGATFTTTSAAPITWNGLADGVTYTFTVQAFNNLGGGGVRTSAPVMATRYAAAPLNVKAWPGNGNAWVTWGPADPRGGPPITGYDVFLCTPTASACYGPTFAPGHFGRAQVNPVGITNGVAYIAVVRAVTARGVNDNGISLNVTLSATAAPFPVQQVSASAGSGNRTWVTWEPPVANGAAPVANYAIWRLVNGAYTQLWENLPATPPLLGTIGTIEITDLTDTRPSTYEVYPRNTNGYIGAPGPGSATSVVTPAANAAPYSPQRPAGSLDPVNRPGLQAGDGQVIVNWSSPAPNGATSNCGTPTGYAVYLVDRAGGPLLSQTVTGTSAVFTFLPAGPGQPGVINDHTYIGVVYALNTSGACANSGTSGPAYTASGTPSSILGDLFNITQPPTATRGDQEAFVTWRKPGLGLDGLTTYTITATPSPGGNPAPAVGPTTITTGGMTGGPLLTQRVGGLRNGTLYTFTVTANLGLLIPTTPSPPSNTITPAGRPFPPVIGTATRGDQSATLTWQPPPDDPATGVPGNNGDPITRYDVQVLDSGLNVITTQANVLSGGTVGPLINGTSYQFRVVAINGVGTSDPSDPSNDVIPAGRPFRPTDATALLTDDRTANVSWLAPATQGGVPGDNGDSIFYYRVITSPPCSTCNGTLTSGTSTTITGLRPSTPYTFRVVARNGVGDSAPSDSTNVVTTPAPEGVPAAPMVLSVSSSGSGQASLTWSQPDSNGSPIIDYTVTSEPAGPTITTATNTVTITGLSDGTGYRFAVVARNAIGTGPAGYSETVTPAGSPGSPAPVQTVMGDGSFVLSWTSGGPGISYTVTTYDSNGLVSPPPPTQINGTSATVTGLAGATKYYFAVTATNPAGQPNVAFSRTVVTYNRQQADAWMSEPLGDFLNRRDQAPEPYNWTADGCSFVRFADPIWAEIFKIACFRHDFGYRNYGNIEGFQMKRDEDQRESIDNQLFADMVALCDDRAFLGPDCYTRAAEYHATVRLVARFAFYG